MTCQNMGSMNRLNWRIALALPRYGIKIQWDTYETRGEHIPSGGHDGDLVVLPAFQPAVEAP